MAGYLGHRPPSTSAIVDEFTSSGGTTYTLTKAPGAKNNIQVSAGGLTQYPSAYSVSGTTLTLTGVPSGQKVVVRHMGDTIPYPLLADDAVTSAKIANDAVTGAKLNPALVAGDVIYADGTDTINRLAKGTAAQVLTMNAGATAPEWAAAAGGGGGAWNLLQSTTISSSTASVAWGSSYITSTYKRFKVQVLDTIPVSDNVRFDMNFTTDNGSSYITTNYRGGTHWLYGNNSSFADASAGGGGDSYLRAGGNNNGNATGERGNYIIYLDNLTFL